MAHVTRVFDPAAHPRNPDEGFHEYRRRLAILEFEHYCERCPYPTRLALKALLKRIVS